MCVGNSLHFHRISYTTCAIFYLLIQPPYTFLYFQETLKKVRGEQGGRPNITTQQRGMQLRSGRSRSLTHQNLLVSNPDVATSEVVNAVDEQLNSKETPMEVDFDEARLEDEVGASRSMCLDEVDNP